MQMLIDVNSDRCIYHDGGMKYEITPDQGHFFDRKPFRIEFTSQVKLEFEGKTWFFALSEFPSTYLKGSTGLDDVPLTSITFEATVPDTNEKLYYDWHGAENGVPMIWPYLWSQR